MLKLSCYPPVEITLGLTTAQDVLLDLGPPLRKFWKEDERLDRVWGQGGGAGGCFWNYFQYGLDVLIVDDVVDKIIAYSNIVSLATPAQLTPARNATVPAVRAMSVGC